MRVVSFRIDGRESYGLVDPNADMNDVDASVVEVPTLGGDVPADAVAFIAADAVVRADVASRAASVAGVPLSQLDLLPAVPHPGNVICIGVNYLDHAIESGLTAAPEFPVIFMKLSSAIAAHGQDVVDPGVTASMDYEAELGVVISRAAYRVEEEDALDYVGGYVAMNDVSARDYQHRTGQWVQGKSFPTFAPTGPYLVTPDEFGDPQDSRVRFILNGAVMQDQPTSDMIFSVRTLVSYLSTIARLQPGDIIATGTPSGIGAALDPPVVVRPGDIMRVEVQGLPPLENRVVARA